MAADDIQPVPGGEPELNLLMSKSDLDQPLWKSLFQNLDEFFFPKKQAPLVLTSKPIPVKDIWGFYDYKKNGALGSTVVHLVAVVLIIGGTILGRRVVQQIKTSRGSDADIAGRYSSAVAFEDSVGRRWRWW